MNTISTEKRASLDTLYTVKRPRRILICAKRTSSFGVDERRCKRGIIATCYYLFVGRLVTRVGRLTPEVGRERRESVEG